MRYAYACIVAAVLLLAAALWGPTLAARERYGPPPGVRRAVDAGATLTAARGGWDGWASFDPVFRGVTTSALLGDVDLSA